MCGGEVRRGLVRRAAPVFATKLFGKHLLDVCIAESDGELQREPALGPRKRARMRQQRQRAFSASLQVVLKEGLRNKVAETARSDVVDVPDELVEEAFAMRIGGVLDDPLRNSASIPSGKHRKCAPPTSHGCVTGFSQNWAPVATHSSDLPLKSKQHGLERERGSVLNNGLQDEVRVPRFVQILDGARAKQNAQNLRMMRHFVFRNHGLQSSAPGAVEGCPNDPLRVQVHQFAV